MNQKIILPAVAALLLITGTGIFLAHAKTNRCLGEPGVKTRELGTGTKVEVVLPESLPGWTSENMTQSKIVLDTLPQDTSFGQRIYKTADGFQCLANVVLMGTDRTSIHQPQICLPGQGWQIDGAASGISQIHLEKPFAYDLPVMRIVATLDTKDAKGQPITVRGQYVYWFVDGERFTADQASFKWEIARHILQRGTLDRWAYIAYFAYGQPGQEELIFERMKQLITATVPEFQLIPRAKN